MIAALWALAACGGSEPEPTAGPGPRAIASLIETASGGREPVGFVIWESNRSGAWRLWRSDLEGRGVVQLTADERGRRHCCPHISPDGRRIAYLSLPEGRQRYLDESGVGQLRLLSMDGSSTRAVAEGARTYFEHRAAVWIDENALHYIAADGGVRRLDIQTGAESVVLDPTGDLERRWIVDATGRWAASGRAVLAQIVERKLGEEIVLPGCQPYFTSDGSSAYWTAGAGGPIDRFDLATGEAAMILGKNDSRLPAGRGYLYFPMLSADGTLLAFAASDGEHDHFRADYDLFLAEVDASTSQLLGRPWPVAPHPAVDRFPDVWRGPLELGRAAGEVPFELTLEAPDDSEWTWRLAGAKAGTGSRLETTLTASGRYAVTASSGERRAHGLVVVTAPSSSTPLGEGWPARRDGLLWSWSAVSGVSTTPLVTRGRGAEGDDSIARPLRLAGRSFAAELTAELLHAGLQRTNQLGLELVFTTPRTPRQELSAILAVGRDGSRENLLVGQRGNRLVLRMRVGSKREGPYAELDLGPLSPGRRLHLALAYTPGRLKIFRDGELAERRRDLRGHFFQWKAYPLVLGDRDRGGADWGGTLEAVALFDRQLTAEEVEANADLLSGG